MFSDFTWKKNFALGNGREAGAPLSPLSLRHCLSSNHFPFLKVHPYLLWYKRSPFKHNYLATVFKVKQYGFEIFRTVLSQNCKIIWLKMLSFVINLSLISNKAPNLFSAICSEINSISNTNLKLL